MGAYGQETPSPGEGEQASPARAPEVEAKLLDTVTVTATRREENLSEVPMSISVMDESMLVEQGIKGVEDLNAVVPGLHMLSVNIGGGINYQMRGIASQVGAGTVAIYVDDTPIHNRNSKFTSSANPGLFDLERIEVLRGPQGTLFGASSQGGAVRFITPQPDLEEWSGHARAEFVSLEGGSTGQELGVAVGGPIAEGRVGMRASFFSRKHPGWVDQVSRVTGEVTDKNINEGDTQSARLALKFQVSDRLSVTPSVLYTKVEYDSWPAYYESLGPYRNAQNIQQPSKDEFLLPTLSVEYALERADFMSTTSYFDRSYARVDDFSAIISDFYSIVGGDPEFLVPNGSGYARLEAPGYELLDQTNWTQEFRLSSRNPGSAWKWIAGLYFSKADLYEGQHVYASEPPLQRLQLFPDNSAMWSDSWLEEKHIAAFGDVGWQATDRLALSAGMRVDRAEISMGQQSRSITAPMWEELDISGIKDTTFTPKLTATYQYGPNRMIYANVANGYRPGGGNKIINETNCATQIAQSGKPGQIYNADEVWNYEVGTKGAFLDNRLRLSGSLYHIDWDNIQQSITLTGCGYNYVGNMGSATSQGAELEAQMLLGDAFTVGVNAAYTRARLSEDVWGSPNPDTDERPLLGRDGDRVIMTPDWTLAVNARYDWTISSEAGVYGYALGDYRYFGDYTRYPGPESTLHNALFYEGKAYSTINLRAGVEWGGLDVSVFANNLLNDDTINYKASGAFISRQVTLLSTIMPRTVGITAVYRW